MSEPRCERTELPRSMCDHCRPAPPPSQRTEPQTDLDDGYDFDDSARPDHPSTVAQYPGDCPCGCGDDIVVGDRITLTDDGWVLAGCAR